MAPKVNQIVNKDCVKGLKSVEARSIDLVFADPPFNIGYQYDKYDDRRACDDYLDWSEEWITQVKRVLSPTGAFWLAIGDEYAAELKVLATRKLGFHCRSWVVWYYTFGVHCHSKFTRSHAHLFHFVNDRKSFTFNDSEVRVPSARQLVYADKRANPKGRVPDDTWIMRPTPEMSWILRPQDLPEGFTADSDTWYFPRICGTFKERQGFHGCQMPEQLLSRIIRACSHEGELVLDPFAGSGTTLAVARKLRRDYLGFELSENYAREARSRVSNARPGTPIEGAANPAQSGKPTKKPPRPKRREGGTAKIRTSLVRSLGENDSLIIRAFEQCRDGFSIDRLIADPLLNEAFADVLKRQGAQGSVFDWNRRLLNLRKAKSLSTIARARPNNLDQAKIDACEFASEIALHQLQLRFELSLDDLLCAPVAAREFDQLASEIAPGYDALYYRWAALRLRKRSKDWRGIGIELAPQMRNVRFKEIDLLRNIHSGDLPDKSGFYKITAKQDALYVGETASLREWFAGAKLSRVVTWDKLDSKSVSISTCTRNIPVKGRSLAFARKGAKSEMIKRHSPKWNLREPAAA